jgi:hypothetical protein
MAIYPLQLGGSKDIKQIIWQHLIQFETVEPPPAHFSTTRGYDPKDYSSLQPLMWFLITVMLITYEMKKVS